MAAVSSSVIQEKPECKKGRRTKGPPPLTASRGEAPAPKASKREYYTTPWAIMASATLRKPAMFAPMT